MRSCFCNGTFCAWLQQIGRPPERKRIPVLLTVAEVQMVLGLMQGGEGLIARLLHDTGKRLNEGLFLRGRDVDFDRHVIVVRSDKGDKDRVVMLPRSLATSLHEQLAASRTLWAADRAAGRSGQPFRCLAQRLSKWSTLHKRTGMPRSRMRCLACWTVYSP